MKKEEEAERDEILDMEQLAAVARELGVDSKASPAYPVPPTGRYLAAGSEESKVSVPDWRQIC